jgi:outer membrane protein
MIWFIATIELTEEKAVEIALKNNPNFIADSLDVLYAQQIAKEFGTSLWPKLSLQFGYTYNSLQIDFQQLVPIKWGFQEIPPGSGQGIVFPIEVETVNIAFSRHNNYKLGLTLSRPLWTWMRLEKGYALQKEGYQAKYSEFLSKRAQYEFNVRQAYTLALLSRDMVEIARENLEFSKRRMELLDEAYKKGRANRIDYLRAVSDYEMANANLINAENTYKSSIRMLALILNLPDTVEIILTDSLKGKDLEIKEGEIRRYDIEYLRKQVKILEELSREELKGYLPSLVGFVSYNFQRPYGFEDQWGGSWVAGLTLDWTLFDGFSPSVKSKKYKIQAEALKRRIEFLENQAKEDIERARRDYEYALEALKAYEKNLRTMEEAFNLAKEAYLKGRMSYIDFKQVELGYRGAQISYKKTFVDVKMAKLKVEYLYLTSLSTR